MPAREFPNQFGRRAFLAGAGAALICAGCSLDDAVVESAFDREIALGTVDEVLAEIRRNRGFWYRPDGRMWVVEYPAASLGRARSVYSSAELTGMEAGILVLFQKCTNLGCRVPDCVSSQWLECPCCGSFYNQAGELRSGPAPRGMDRFAVEVSDGQVVVNAGDLIEGPPPGTNTTGQEPDGPRCIGFADS